MKAHFSHICCCYRNIVTARHSVLYCNCSKQQPSPCKTVVSAARLPLRSDTNRASHVVLCTRTLVLAGVHIGSMGIIRHAVGTLLKHLLILARGLDLASCLLQPCLACLLPSLQLFDVCCKRRPSNCSTKTGHSCQQDSPARGCLCPAVDHNSMTPGRYHPRRRCCKQHLAVPEGASRSNVPRIQGVLALGSSPELFPSKRIMDNRTPTRGLWFCLDPADPTPNCVSVPVRLCSGSAWAMYDA